MIGIYNVYKKNYRIGIIQILLSPALFIGNFLFSLHREWVNGSETEQEYFIKMLKEFNVNSILILLGFIILIILFMISIKKWKKKCEQY